MCAHLCALQVGQARARLSGRSGLPGGSRDYVIDGKRPTCPVVGRWQYSQQLPARAVICRRALPRRYSWGGDHFRHDGVELLEGEPGFELLDGAASGEVHQGEQLRVSAFIEELLVFRKLRSLASQVSSSWSARRRRAVSVAFRASRNCGSVVASVTMERLLSGPPVANRRDRHRFLSLRCSDRRGQDCLIIPT